MGQDRTASLSYGIIITQVKVLKLLQKLQNSTEKVTKFGYGNGAEDLQELLDEHFEELGIDEKDKERNFQILYLTSGEEIFNGLAILYSGCTEDVTAWGPGSQEFEELRELWKDIELVADADAAFKRLREGSLFKELGIVVDPKWLLGCVP